MESIFFGLGYEFDGGADPGVAIDEFGYLVEVHKNEAGTSLYSRTGQLRDAQVYWNDTGGDRKPYTGGTQPAVAKNNGGDVVEVHKREVGDKLFVMYGKFTGPAVAWSESISYDDDGHDPAVAINDRREIVTVYAEDSDKVRYRRGSITTKDGKTIVQFRAEQDLGEGQYPKVAIDNDGNVIAVWERNVDGKYKLRCCVGKLSTDVETITWGTVTDLVAEEGFRPCVALTNNGFVVAVYNQGSVNLKQMFGRLDASTKTVTWDPATYFDDGVHPAVAAAGTSAVRIAQSDWAPWVNRLWYSTSLITDRANWMHDRLNQIGSKMVKQLFIPGSHDAGMYTGGFSTLGKTQELSIYGQLAAGVRYFDLRVEWNDPVFNIHHGTINGPLLSDVLQQIADFCNEGHQELVILDFSHFTHFVDSGTWFSFVDEVIGKLDPWMYKTQRTDKRLAEITLSEYISSGMKILVVVDEDWPVYDPVQGYWVFRNSDSDTAELGQLRVFDQYSSDANYEDVKKDQTEKYDAYNGYCDPDTNVPCDLFLLSWTCTSPVGVGVWQVSKNINRHLGDFMQHLAMPNASGYDPNILYVDYCEFARVTDVALYANGAPLVYSDKTTPHLEIRKDTEAGDSTEAQPLPEMPPPSGHPRV